MRGASARDVCLVMRLGMTGLYLHLNGTSLIVRCQRLLFYEKQCVARHFDDRYDISQMGKKQSPIEGLHNRGWGLYTRNDKLIVDKVYKFEDLDGAMADIYQRLNISENS